MAKQILPPKNLKGKTSLIEYLDAIQNLGVNFSDDYSIYSCYLKKLLF